MLDKKEKYVVLYLVEMCPQKRPYLILAEKIAEVVSRKYLITTNELDDIMVMLQKENYIEFIVSESKVGNYYCITLKGKAITLKKDIKRQKQQFWIAVFRTFIFAVFSFTVGLLLKTIFSVP